MIRMYKLILFVFILSTILFANEDTNQLKQLHENHIVKKYQTWSGWKDKPLLKRLSTTPRNVIEYIKIDNELFGYDGVPKQVPIDPKFKKDFIAAINELPEKIKKQMEKYLIGIYILSGLGSSGFSEHLYKDNEYHGGFIMFDQDVLSKLTANEWASWRINSAFKKSDEYKLSIKLEEDSTNTTKQAIQFILLHEIAHIVGLSTKAHPRTDKGDPKLFPFSAISWKSFDDSMYDANFKDRKSVKLYRFDKAKLSLNDSTEIISNLKKSDFCSIYASTDFFEDFAEAYTIYVHTVLMKKPYSLKLFHKTKELQSFQNPYEMKNFNKKKLYFDKLLNSNN